MDLLRSDFVQLCSAAARAALLAWAPGGWAFLGVRGLGLAVAAVAAVALHPVCPWKRWLLCTSCALQGMALVSGRATGIAKTNVANMTTWNGFQSEPKGALEEVSRDRADLFLLQGLCMGCFLCLSGSLQGHTERETGLLAALTVSMCFFMPDARVSDICILQANFYKT